jgi:hypothetical protein
VKLGIVTCTAIGARVSVEYFPKMQIANCQVFSLLVVVGLLVFFSSFLTLDLHTSVEELKKLPGHEFFHAPRVRSTSFLDATHNLKDFTAEESIVSAALHLSSRYSEFKHAISPTVQDRPIGLAREPFDSEVQVVTSKQCSIIFPQKCRINPLLKYWDEVMECYTSPLRQFNGLSASKEKQKFVVFQPDSGGWNNIRMALEVVILFAQVSVCPLMVHNTVNTSCTSLLLVEVWLLFSDRYSSYWPLV